MTQLVKIIHFVIHLDFSVYIIKYNDHINTELLIFSYFIYDTNMLLGLSRGIISHLKLTTGVLQTWSQNN